MSSKNKRAERARQICKYANVVFGGRKKSNEPLDTTISDLLVDLRHLCDEFCLDYGFLDKRAHGHYLAELEEDLRAKRTRNLDRKCNHA